jgi:8-amino-7-oxononanoate synthase
MAKMDFISEELNEIKQNDLYRTLKAIEEGIDSKVVIKGKQLVNFCSNDYLGLSSHPKVIEKAIQVLKTHGVGAGASRLVSGNHTIHEDLEFELSAYENTEASIVFPSGYMANIGTIQAIVGKEDAVIIDHLDHASIIDGARLSGAKLLVYPHRDMARLEKILAKSNTFRRLLIVTDHVFSMDGDVAPLDEIAALSKKYKAILMIDTAHSTGILPVKMTDPSARRDMIIMGTLSKAVGSLGGFVSGTNKLIEYLKNKARSFIYTTALPPAITAASIAALEIIRKDDSFRKAIWGNIAYLKKRLHRMAVDTMGSTTQIIPILVGDAKDALKASEFLYDEGMLLTAIRPPTVAEGTSRLRLSLTAKHTKADIDKLADLLEGMRGKYFG